MNKFLLGVFFGVLLSATVFNGARLLKSYAAPVGSIVQVYAGDDIQAAFAAEVLPPSLHVCKNDKNSIFIVLSAETHEFMLFDSGGAFIENARFVPTETESGIPYFESEVNGSLVALAWQGEEWHFIISNSKGVTDLPCH